MDQAAKNVHALNRPVTDRLRQAGEDRCLKVQTAVGPTPVVVLDVGGSVAGAGRDHGADILGWTGNRAQIVDVTPDVLATMIAAGDPLVESWCVDAVHLTGVRLPDLLRQARAS